MQWWTYRNAKARKALGFEPRPHEETLEDAVRWQMAQLGNRVRRDRSLERLSYRRSERPEIEELTGQRRIPVIVDGDEVVHDSRRILQYLDWAYAPREPER